MKDMINCIFLSRDFPFSWFLREFKDVLSWPGERKRNSNPSSFNHCDPRHQSHRRQTCAEISAALGISNQSALRSALAFNVSPLPVMECKQHQSEEVGDQQEEVKVPVQEEPLWQEAPVYCPLKQKLTSEVKRPTHVANGIL